MMRGVIGLEGNQADLPGGTIFCHKCGCAINLRRLYICGLKIGSVRAFLQKSLWLESLA